MLHAYWHPMFVFDLGEDFTMIIGPNQAAIVLEVGVVAGEHGPSSSTR